jgi:hypothetical protein
MGQREKKFCIPGERIKRLVRPMGACYATDRIVVGGESVGYMYRESGGFPQDAGWRFFAGDEPEDYLSDTANIGIYEVNTVANYDPDIIPYLDTPAPCAFEKIAGSRGYRPIDPPETGD